MKIISALIALLILSIITSGIFSEIFANTNFMSNRINTLVVLFNTHE